MKIELQKVIVQVPLSEYAEAYKDAGDPKLHVWVNVPRAMLVKREELDNESYRLYAEIEDKRRAFHESLKKLEKQENEENRKPAAVAKERKRLVDEFTAWQDTQQVRLDDCITRSYAWFTELWSQGPEGTHWPVDDIRMLAEQDPKLLDYLATRSRQLLDERRTVQKNA